MNEQGFKGYSSEDVDDGEDEVYFVKIRPDLYQVNQVEPISYDQHNKLRHDCVIESHHPNGTKQHIKIKYKSLSLVRVLLRGNRRRAAAFRLLFEVLFTFVVVNYGVLTWRNFDSQG